MVFLLLIDLWGHQCPLDFFGYVPLSDWPVRLACYSNSADGSSEVARLAALIASARSLSMVCWVDHPSPKRSFGFAWVSCYVASTPRYPSVWIHTGCSSHCFSICREITLVSLERLTSKLFLFPWFPNRIRFLRFVAESPLTPLLLGYFDWVSSISPVYFFDSSQSRSTILETSLTCIDSSIRRKPVPVTYLPLTFDFPLYTQL